MNARIVKTIAPRTQTIRTGGGFGAHVSVAGGLEKAFAAGVAIGCDCIQIFVKNQRQWKAPPMQNERVRAFHEERRRSGLSPVVAHASYLLNLASPLQALRDRSIGALIDELERCEALEVPYLVIHPGAHMGDGPPAGLARAAAALNKVHQSTSGCGAMILLESTAGQGTTLGRDIAELSAILSQVRNPERIGICLDTCHLFASGYDLRKGEEVGRLLDELREHVGLDRVRCIHTNDSATPCGSHVDRHAHIGRGKMGARAFEAILACPAFRGIPKILETPKGTDDRGRDWDRVNLGRLRRLTAGARIGMKPAFRKREMGAVRASSTVSGARRNRHIPPPGSE